MKKLVLTVPLCLALGIFSAPPATASTKDDLVKIRPATTENPTPGTQEEESAFKDPVERFVESNVLETLYHELAHALIDKMNLPVFGPEEFAADYFAAILLDLVHDPDTTRQIVADVLASYRYDGQQNKSVAWGEHGSAMQRYYNLACLYYGADPDRRKGALSDFNLPDERANICPAEYEQANFAWGEVLEELGEAAPGNSISLDWVLDKDSHLTRYVAKEVAALNAMLVLPEPIVVSVIPCGEVNAYYDPSEDEIIICTELSEHLARIAP